MYKFASAAVTDDTFSCYLRLLAGMGYNRVEEADRSSAFIRVVKEDARFLLPTAVGHRRLYR